MKKSASELVAKNRQDGSYCAGYTVQRYGDDGRTNETLYAVMPDSGAVLATNEQPYSVRFAGHVWHAVDGLPEAAEFIGVYPAPQVTA